MRIWFFKPKLLYQMIGLVVTVTLVPIAFLGYQLITMNQLALENHLLEYHTQLASATAQRISQIMTKTMAGLEEIGEVLIVNPSLKESGVKNLLLLFAGRNEPLMVLTYRKPDLKSVVTVGIGQEGDEYPDIVPFLQEVIDKSPVRENWIVGKAIPYPAKQTLLLPVAVPLFDFDTGRLTGILGALVDLKQVQEVISDVRLRRRGFAFLVDGEGFLLAHPEEGLALKRADFRKMEIVGTFLKIGRTGGTVPFMDQGEEMLGAYEPVRELGWGVILQEPKSEAYSSIALMRRQTLWLMALSGILAALIGGLYASHLARPLRELSSRALAIARGDFKIRIKIRAGNELGQLAETFNYMGQQLDLYNRDMRELLLGSLKSLAAAIDAKDPYTRGHSERVTRFSMAIAQEMGYQGKDLDDVNMAALLHDIGKIGIEDSILRKPGLLTKEEYGIIKRHPGIGGEIMGAIKQLKDVVPAIRYHHEALDGSGYPEGRRGDDIPVAARIIAVADSFDAMTSERPYQQAMDDQHVLDFIESMAGKRYDPQVVQALMSAYSKGLVSRHPEKGTA